LVQRPMTQAWSHGRLAASPPTGARLRAGASTAVGPQPLVGVGRLTVVPVAAAVRTAWIVAAWWMASARPKAAMVAAGPKRRRSWSTSPSASWRHPETFGSYPSSTTKGARDTPAYWPLGSPRARGAEQT
jgi:hypothetical protein